MMRIDKWACPLIEIVEMHQATSAVHVGQGIGYHSANYIGYSVVYKAGTAYYKVLNVNNEAL